MKLLIAIAFSAGVLFAQAPMPNTSGGSGGGGAGTVTSVGFTGGLISVATPTTTPALTVAGTSGGIPYFSAASTWASSGLLAANAIVIGGGAGTTPSTTTTGTGILTFLGTPSSANLASAVTDESGSGALVFANTPTLVTPVLGAATGTSVIVSGGLSGATYSTATNCADSAGAAACGSAAAGAFVIDAGSTSTVVSTTAVTANSEIFVQIDDSLGTRLTVTCNTGIATAAFAYISARTASTSFTVSITGTVAVNPLCLTYHIVN